MEIIDQFSVQAAIGYAQNELLYNEVLMGVVLSGIAFSVIYYLREIPKKIFNVILNFIIRKFTAEVTIESDNPFYDFVINYLNKKGFINNHTRRLYIERTLLHDLEANNFDDNSAFTLGPGFHLKMFKGRPILFHHEFKEQSQVNGTMAKTLSIKTLGRSNKLIKNFFKEVIELWYQYSIDKISINMYQMSSWKSVMKKKRPIETLAMRKELKNDIIEDIDWFSNSEEWYNQRGIPYRRSFLLYGPPGTGKTSTVFSFASYFNKEVHIINLSDILSDSRLIEVISEVPSGSFLLLEDIDAMNVNVSREQAVNHESEEDMDDDSSSNLSSKSMTKGNGITLSGLLNALDGILSPTGVVVWMTTNHPEKLDPALLRPGRVDKKIYLGHASREEAKQMFNNFFPDSTNGEVFADAFENQNVYKTTADLQELLIENNDPELAIEKINERGGE